MLETFCSTLRNCAPTFHLHTHNRALPSSSPISDSATSCQARPRNNDVGGLVVAAKSGGEVSAWRRIRGRAHENGVGPSVCGWSIGLRPTVSLLSFASHLSFFFLPSMCSYVTFHLRSSFCPFSVLHSLFSLHITQLSDSIPRRLLRLPCMYSLQIWGSTSSDSVVEAPPEQPNPPSGIEYPRGTRGQRS